MSSLLETTTSERLLDRINDRSAKIGVIGLGYVGLPLAASAGRAGFDIIGFDIDPDKAARLNDAESYIDAVSSEDLARLIAAGRFRATADFARLVPNAMHVGFLKRLAPKRRDGDVFPVAYKLNTLADLKKHFSPDRWEHHSFLAASTPKYFGGNPLLFSAIDFYQNAAPASLKTELMVFLRKRQAAA